VKLIVDNSNIETIPIGNLQDIGDMARRFADQVEANDYGEVTRVMVIVETPDGLSANLWGENANGYEKIGMLASLQMMIFADGED
jgi:hypothetical protein